MWELKVLIEYVVVEAVDAGDDTSLRGLLASLYASNTHIGAHRSGPGHASRHLETALPIVQMLISRLRRFSSQSGLHISAHLRHQLVRVCHSQKRIQPVASRSPQHPAPCPRGNKIRNKPLDSAASS